MHGGASSAFTAFVPEENLAIAILTNLPTFTWLSPVDVNWNKLPSALVLRILDIYVGGSGRDWSREYLAWVEALNRDNSFPMRNKNLQEVKYHEILFDFLSFQGAQGYFDPL